MEGRGQRAEGSFHLDQIVTSRIASSTAARWRTPSVAACSTACSRTACRRRLPRLIRLDVPNEMAAISDAADLTIDLVCDRETARPECT